MKRISFVSIGILSVTLLSGKIFAQKSIMVEVTANYSNVAGIGFSVQGKKFGSMGNHYRHQGPMNAVYSFGMRQGSIFSDDIDCGAMTLAKDSKVTLVMHGKQCTAEISA